MDLKHGDWSSDALRYDDILNYHYKPGYSNSDIYWIDSKVLDEFRVQ